MYQHNMSLSIINDNNNSNSNININNISSNGALSAPTMVSCAEFCCPINPFNSVSEQRESTNIHPIECQSNKTNDAGKLCDHKQPSSGKTSSRKGEFKTTFYNPFETKHRRRTSRAQFEILEAAFEENPKPSAAKRSSLAQKLSMTPRGVQIWFQNRRAKAKQQQCRPNNQHDETRKRSSVRPSTKPLYTEWDSQEPLKRSVTDDGRNGITHVISSPGTCDGTDPAKTQTIHDNALTSLEEQPLTPELVPSISDPWQQPQPVYTTPTWEADQVWYENTNEMQQQEFLLPPYCDNETGNQRHRQPSNQNYAVPIIDPSAIVPDVIYEQPLPDWQAMQPPCSSDFVQSNCHMRRKTNESGYSDDFEFSGDLLSLPAAVHDGVANINNKDLFIVGFAEDQESPVGNFSTSTHIVLPRYDPYYFVTSPLGVSYS